MDEILNIAILSNITLEPYLRMAVKQYFGENVEITYVPFEEYQRNEYQRVIENAALIVVWLNLAYMSPGLYYSGDVLAVDEIAAICEKLLVDIKNASQAKILWFSFENYEDSIATVVGHLYRSFVDRLNLTLENILGDTGGLIDLKYLVAEIGISNAYDPKGKYRWNAIYSKALVESAVKEIYKQYLIEHGHTKKCLVLDCDNVLWGGVVSEDGLENIKLGSNGMGRIYQDFQRFVLYLYHHGVILAVCSKNELDDVLTMFREHEEMLLKEQHIAYFSVSWQDKPNSIREIAEKLNIGLDSMVFVDDSIMEIEAIKAMLPDVATILFERGMKYDQFSCFNLRNNVNTTATEKRNETYRTNGLREALKAKYTDYLEYIKALEIKMDIHRAMPIEYERISELTQRTNRCTNGKRYTVAEIKNRVSRNGVKLYSVSVSDRFCDLGLVGTIEVENDTLTLFSLSCRALGREVERKMSEFISDKHKIELVEFKLTGKNETFKTFLQDTFSHAKFFG